MKLTRLLMIMVTLSLVFCCNMLKSDAVIAPPSIKVSPAYVAPGGTITVTVSTGENSAEYSIDVTNGSGDVGTEAYYTNSVNTFKCIAGQSGTVTIKVDGSYTNRELNYSTKTLTKTVFVHITEPEDTSSNTPTPTPTPTPTTPAAPVKSSVSTISSLSVVGHDLNVEFNSSTKEYNVSVAADVEKITINAAATDSKASVSGTGEKTISEGDNNFEVVCTAENGSKSTYKINVHRKLEPLVFLTYGSATLGVVRDFKNVSIPDDYSEEPVTVSDQEIAGFYAKNIARNLVYLEDEQGQESWYVVADNEILTEISAATLLGLNGYIITVPAELIDIEGCTPAIIGIDDREVPGWTFDEEQFSDYRLIYYMDEAGNEDIYQYELSQNTLQIWEGSTISNEQYSAMISQVDNLESSLQTYTYATYGLGGALGLGTLLVLIKSRKSRSLKKQSI